MSGPAPGAIETTVNNTPVISTLTELHFDWGSVGTNAGKIAIN